MAGRQAQRGLVQGRCALGPFLSQLGHRAVGQRQRHFFGVVGRGRMIRDPVQVGGRVPPAACLEAVLAQGNPQHELSGQSLVGLHQLPVAFVKAPQLLVDLAQPVIELGRLLGLTPHAPERLVQPALGPIPLLLAVQDVGHGDHGGQVVGVEVQRLVEPALGLGEAVGFLAQRAGQIGQHRGLGRRRVAQAELPLV